MQKLIDAEHFYKELFELYQGIGWDERDVHFSLADIKCNLELMPTVDAVEVVRCKDCKYREVQVDGVFCYEMCGIRSEIINLEGFCHMGKRREDAKTH